MYMTIEMSQVVYVRIPEKQVEALDRLVNQKLYASRSSIIQEAVSDWLFERGHIHPKKSSKEEAVT